MLSSISTTWLSFFMEPKCQITSHSIFTCEFLIIFFMSCHLKESIEIMQQFKHGSIVKCGKMKFYTCSLACVSFLLLLLCYKALFCSNNTTHEFLGNRSVILLLVNIIKSDINHNTSSGCQVIDYHCNFRQFSVQIFDN